MSIFSLLTIFHFPIILCIFISIVTPSFSCFFLSSTPSFHTPFTRRLTSPRKVPFIGSSPKPVILMRSFSAHSSLTVPLPSFFSSPFPYKLLRTLIPLSRLYSSASPYSCVLGPTYANLILCIILSATFHTPSIHSSLLASSHSSHLQNLHSCPFPLMPSSSSLLMCSSSSGGTIQPSTMFVKIAYLFFFL